MKKTEIVCFLPNKTERNQTIYLEGQRNTNTKIQKLMINWSISLIKEPINIQEHNLFWHVDVDLSLL